MLNFLQNGYNKLGMFLIYVYRLTFREQSGKTVTRKGTDKQHKARKKELCLLTVNSSMTIFLETKKEPKTYQMRRYYV
jgi:hypothetical protein